MSQINDQENYCNVYHNTQTQHKHRLKANTNSDVKFDQAALTC